MKMQDLEFYSGSCFMGCSIARLHSPIIAAPLKSVMQIHVFNLRK